MNKTISVKGRCLCGAVKLESKSASDSVGACHCNMCRKWVGGPLLAIDCGTDVEVFGEESVAVFTSSDWAERGFCKTCGSSLFYKLKGTGQYIVPAGILDDKGDLNFDHQVFIEEKPSYYCFSNKTKDMTGAELFAQYSDD